MPMKKHKPEQIVALLRQLEVEIATHAIPESQRRAVDKIAEVLFTNVHKISATTENQKVN